MSLGSISRPNDKKIRQKQIKAQKKYILVVYEEISTQKCRVGSLVVEFARGSSEYVQVFSQVRHTKCEIRQEYVWYALK